MPSIYALARRKPYSWLNKFLFRMPKTQNQLVNKYSMNVWTEGSQGSGKSYLLDYLLELAIGNYGAKPYILWCESIDILRERLKMLFPNGKNPNGKGYKILVLCPMTENMPNKLPEFFIPFSIPVGGLGTFTLQSIFGIKEYSVYEREYYKRTRKKMTYVDLKRFVRESHGRSIDPERVRLEITEEGFMGYHHLVVKKERIREEKFQRSFELFDKIGVLNNSDFPYSLDKILELILHDNSHMVILYTGFEEDDWLKRFVFLYFLETLRRLCKKQMSMKFRNIILLPEIQDLCKSDFDKSAVEIDYIVNSAVKYFVNKGRHFNCDVWADSKPQSSEKHIRKLFGTQLFTRIETTDVLSDIVRHTQHDGKELTKIFNNMHYVRTYGFIDLKETKIPIWRTPFRTYTYGYRLFSLKKSSDIEPQIDNDVYASLYDLGFGSIDSYALKQTFMEERKRVEAPVIERLVSKIIQTRQAEAEQGNRIGELRSGKNEIIVFLDDQFQQYGKEFILENMSIWVDDWCRKYDVSRRTVELWISSWRGRYLSDEKAKPIRRVPKVAEPPELH